MRVMGRWLTLAVSAVLIVMLGVAARRWAHGLSFVVQAADMHGLARWIADLDGRDQAERILSVPTARGPLRARLYQPLPPGRPARRAALLVSGLHPAGVDEPRLVALARQLAGHDLAVVTPDIPELSRFEITPDLTDAIEQAAGWLSSSSGLSPDSKVGLLGVSFSGGLSVVAAGRPSLAGKVAFVLALGGHDDLPRVLRYLCTGTEPLRGGGAAPYRAPHDYGLAVILLGVADRIVPPRQAETLRAAVRRYLWASHLDRVDKPQAEGEFARLRALAPTLPEPSATLLKYVNDRDVARLGPRLLPYIGHYGGDPRLSPSKSPKTSAPVFLLHGVDDNVIPAIESEYLADDLRTRAPVRLLLSGLISHAEVDRQAHVVEVLKLAGFWGDLLSR